MTWSFLSFSIKAPFVQFFWHFVSLFSVLTRSLHKNCSFVRNKMRLLNLFIYSAAQHSTAHTSRENFLREICQYWENFTSFFSILRVVLFLSEIKYDLSLIRWAIIDLEIRARFLFSGKTSGLGTGAEPRVEAEETWENCKRRSLKQAQSGKNEERKLKIQNLKSGSLREVEAQNWETEFKN